MKWIDRQGSTNVKDLRQLGAGLSGNDPIAELIAQTDMVLTSLENMAAGVPPLPRRRPVGKPDDWAGQARLSAQQFSDEVKTPPLPRPDPRRYKNGQE